MDALFWKTGTIMRPLVTTAAAAGQTLEGSDATQARSVQVSAHRSCPSQLSSTITTNAPPMSSEETSNAAFGTPVGPLPLPPSRSLVPAPLKFLWFKKKNQRQSKETRDRDLSSEPRESGVHEEGETRSLLDDRGTTMDQQKENEISNDSKGEEFFLISDVTSGATQENLKRRSESDIPTATDKPKSVELKQRPDSTTTAGRNARGWVSRFLDLRALWQDSRKYGQKLSISSEGELQLNPPASSPGASTENGSPTDASTNGSRCPGCQFDSLQGCTLEVPHTRVLHSKESFSKFLQDASLFDMKVTAQMSFLCDLAYMIPDIKPGELLKHHRLRFITSSLDRKAEAAAKAKESDAGPDLSATTIKSNPPCKQEHGGTVGDEDKEGIDTNAGLVLELAGAAASYIQSHTKSSLPPQTEKDGLTGSKEKSSDGSLDSVLSAVLKNNQESQAAVGLDNRSQQSAQGSSTEEYTEKRSSSDVDSLMAVAPVTAVVVAEEETKQAVAKDLQSLHFCPCEWFVCDDYGSHTRFFVIQGSESLASWQANLLFEPMKFEGLGVLVHRGIYEAAKGLYEQLLPEVLAHFKAYGELAQVRFTGHSLGGSLAALLALMFQIRGVLPRSSILPVITFGSPCVMCGGDYLLQKLNLPLSHIQSVIMHRDIVPRAFACDYPEHVAQVLKRLNGRFRNHPCLNQQRLLYTPMGQILILQPDEREAPPHPLLPSGNGLYLVRHFFHGQDIDKATELRAAQRAFLNMPHPLEILSDPGAYGFEGAISRDHDPRSYSKAIHVALRQELKRVRRVQREQRRQLWWPLVIAESSLFVQKGAKLGVNTEGTRTCGAVSPAVGKPSLAFKQSVTYAIANRVEFPLGNGSVLRPHKDAFSRYARVIASQHVQMGMLFILSVRMLILEGLSTIFIWI